MFSEVWTQWKPAECLEPKYHIDLFFEDPDDFKVMLSSSEDKNKKNTLIFEAPVFAYRKVDKKFRQNLIKLLDEKCGSEFCGTWSFFKVSDSSYINWINEQSYGWSNYIGVTHFSIIADDSVFDIVSSYEPKVIFSS